ncbi:MAG: RcpC/CpaB family pilus assembly protein [Arthrobacter oryzae]
MASFSTPRPSLPGSGRTSGRPPHRRAARWLSRNRRLAVALLLCVAAGLVVQQLTPSPAATVAALAAARDLPAGSVLDSGDVRTVAVPAGLIPNGSFAGAERIPGSQLAVALRQGQLLTDSQFLGPGLLAGSPPGSAAVPLRMADPGSIQLVSPGQLVSVILTIGNGFEQPAESQVLAAGVPVLWTSAQGGTPGLWSASGETDGLMVVAAAADQARQLAGASTRGKLFFVLVGAAAPG